MARRQPFDIRKPLGAARSFTFAGVQFAKGDPFPVEGFSPRLVRRQYEAHAIDHVGEESEVLASERVTIDGGLGGNYTVDAPWLDKPEKVRGKDKAEALATRLRDDGPPLGWIEGGSAVTVADGDGGWYTVEAPWLDAPERIQGRDAAEARQRELHDAG